MSKFWSKKPPWAIVFLGSLLAVALLRDLIANDRPLFCQIDGQTFFPAFRTIFTDADRVNWRPPFDVIHRENLWHSFDYQSVVFCPVPFRAGQTIKKADWQRPFSTVKIEEKKFKTWFGTDGSGHDVAAGIVAGTWVAIWVGILAMGVAGLIGILLGSLAGYFGDDRLQVRRGVLWANFLGVPTAIFFALVPRKYFLFNHPDWLEIGQSIFIFISILLVFNFLGRQISQTKYFSKKITIPADLLVMRLTEIFLAIPGFIVVISVAAVASLSRMPLSWMVVIVGCISWMGVARLLRAELLRVREMEFVESARALGLPDSKIILRHALPNSLRPVWIALALGMAGAVMLEASLSFLGFTSTQAGTSWGSLLNEGRGNYQFWWVSVFPGIAICLTILALHAVSGREN